MSYGYGYLVLFEFVAAFAMSLVVTAILIRQEKKHGHWGTNSPLHSSAAQQSGPGHIGALSQPLVTIPTWPFAADRSDDYPSTSEGIRAGEVIGWRAWKLPTFTDDPILASVTAWKVWQPDEPMQGDVKYWGVHAFKDRETALAEFGRLPGCVIGSVEMWGEIVEHEHGWRAEFARVKSLDVFVDKRVLAKWTDEEIEEIARKMGDVLPGTLAVPPLDSDYLRTAGGIELIRPEPTTSAPRLDALRARYLGERAS